MTESIIRRIGNDSTGNNATITNYTEKSAMKSDAHSTKNNAVTSYSSRSKTEHPALCAT